MHWSKLPNAEEIKKLIREARALQTMKQRSLESKQRMSKIMRGNKNANGKKSDEHKKKISEAHKRIGSPWLVGKKRRPFSECHRLNISLAKRGEKHPFWRGGIAVINEGERKSLRYRQWRKKILKRDDYTCTRCGSKKNLEVDHIKSFARFPKFRYSLKNGRTLCHSCHVKTDTYGVKSRSKKV